ncbi:uncharacterized protein LOC110180653 [Drosophila serrata]|uniref:uncharacterized protein LOC110180653 n=1 Tax=Drosophila serrata TaxID=7274 RepID=UPI000A1D1327|nr:uncharacterized protein LOC110180653 [Drosophila serrata]
MASKDSLEKDKPSEEATASSSKPTSSRRGAHRRVQEENTNHMAKVFDMLERTKNNMKELERQRISHLEGLKHLRDRLFRENEALRLTAATLAGNSVSGPIASSGVLPGSSKLVPGNCPSLEVATIASSSLYPRWQTSSKSVSIARTSSKNLSLATTSMAPPPPRASSSRSLYRKKNQRYFKRSKQRMLPSNQDNNSGISGESEQVVTAKT